MSTTKDVTPFRASMSTFWRLPVVFIGATQLVVPLVLLLPPKVARTPGGWIGSSLFVAELIGLSYTAVVTAFTLGPFSGADAALVALTIFICLPATIVPYLGLRHCLSYTSVPLTTGALETTLLVIARIYNVGSFRSKAFSPYNLSLSERFVLSLSFLAFAVMALNAVRYTACDSDSMWYHLPLVAELIKSGSVAPIASMPLIARAYPAAREAVLAWLSWPMTSDNVALFFLVEVPGVLVAIWAICREFDVPRATSFAMAALFLTTPEISMWAASQKNDLFLALSFLLSLFFMLRFLRTGSDRYAVLAGLAGGLLCATKLSGPGYAAVLGSIFVGAVILRKKVFSAERQPAHGARTALLIFVPMIVIAAPWYARNFFYFGNPFYPKRIVIFGRIVFPGPLGKQFFGPVTLGFHFLRLFGYWRRFFEGFGVALPILVAAPLMIFVAYIVRHARGRAKDCADLLLWVVILPVLLLLLYMEQPFSIQPRGINSWEVQPRYMFSFAACLHISLGFLMPRSARHLRYLLPIVVLAMFGNLAWWTHFWWALGILAVFVAILIPFVSKWRLNPATANLYSARWPLAAVGAVAFIAAVAGFHQLDRFRERQKDDPEYGYRGISAGWAQISAYVRHDVSGKRLLCLGRPEKFPFYGRGYTNSLYSCDGCDLLNTIQLNDIDYVIGIRPFERRGEEWVYFSAPTESLRKRYPDKFYLVYSYEGAEVLEVIDRR